MRVVRRDKLELGEDLVARVEAAVEQAVRRLRALERGKFDVDEALLLLVMIDCCWL